MLENSNDAPFTLKGIVNNAVSNGVPATAITGVVDDANNDLRLVAPGQTVMDITASGCFPDETKVVAVWPVKNVIYVSNPATCTSSGSTHNIQFTDSSPPESSPDCTHDDVTHRCMIFDAGFRFGDGIDIHDTGGASVDDCSVLEHMVEFHMNTGANNARLTNCESVSNVSLPDRNLASMNAHTGDDDDNDRQNIVSLLIDGAHKGDLPVPPPDADLDACEVKVLNSRLGQHRPVGVVVNSQNCDHDDDLANVGFGMANEQGNAITVEADQGDVKLANAHATTSNVFVSDQAKLFVSNIDASNTPLYLQSSAAAANAHGCGNVFASPTPYLCAPSSFTQPPGGRLALPQGATKDCTAAAPPPVMTQDVTGATCVFYVPYLNPQVPIFNTATGAFGLSDIGTGLSLDLDTSVELTGNAYDIFAETLPGQVELCAGPGWTGSARSPAVNVVQVNGIWVNQQALSCSHHSGGDRSCPPSACTYLGTIEPLTHDGQISQQFGPVSASTGNPNCLCLYNAYNRVPVTSAFSYPTAYTYGSATWEIMNGNAVNQIYYVDGLAQTQASAQLTDAMKNAGAGTGRTAEMGVAVDAVASPLPIAIANSPTQATYNSAITITPKYGLRDVIAVESAQGTGASAGFGGSNLQLLSVQVAD